MACCNIKSCFSLHPSESPLRSLADQAKFFVSPVWLALLVRVTIFHCVRLAEALWGFTMLKPVSIHTYKCKDNFRILFFIFKKGSFYSSFPNCLHTGTRACLMRPCSCLLFVQAAGDQVDFLFCVSLTWCKPYFHPCFIHLSPCSICFFKGAFKERRHQQPPCCEKLYQAF